MDFLKPLDSGFTVYSKSGCVNCVKVKALLKEKNANFLVIDCDEYLLEDKLAFLQFIHLLVGKDYKMFPMVFLNGTFVGGYKETEEHFQRLEEKELDFDNTDF
jgi:glutaredoxin